MSDISLGETPYVNIYQANVASLSFERFSRIGVRRPAFAYASRKAISPGAPFPALVRRLRRLPIVRKANYRAGFLQFLQELAHRFGLPGQDQIGSDVGQRLQDKFSQVQPRVRQSQLLIFNVAGAVIEPVDSDHSRDIFWMMAP